MSPAAFFFFPLLQRAACCSSAFNAFDRKPQVFPVVSGIRIMAVLSHVHCQANLLISQAGIERKKILPQPERATAQRICRIPGQPVNECDHSTLPRVRLARGKHPVRPIIPAPILMRRARHVSVQQCHTRHAEQSGDSVIEAISPEKSEGRKSVSQAACAIDSGLNALLRRGTGEHEDRVNPSGRSDRANVRHGAMVVTSWISLFQGLLCTKCGPCNLKKSRSDLVNAYSICYWLAFTSVI